MRGLTDSEIGSVYTHIHIYVMSKDIIRQDHLGSLEPISYANQRKFGIYATHVYINWYTDMS